MPASHPASAHGPDEDDRLAAQLIAMGRLNPWQVEQLKRGRSKFNLGPYQVIDSIGQGGMGQVFRAEHTMMGRTVAIKVLPRYKSTPVAIASFTREIRAQAQMDHENLVRAFDAGHDGNVYFLVTECVPGSDLRKFVRIRGRLSMTEAATIISQAAVGLGHAHSRGLDPSRREAGQPAGDDDRPHESFRPGAGRLFGRRRRRRSALGQGGRHGRLSGSRADRHAQGHHAGHATSTRLGCTLYYAVTGKVPFPGGIDSRKGPPALRRGAAQPQTDQSRS